MALFKIIQEVTFDEIQGELLDNQDYTIGYVSDEFFAQEFCNTHKNCSYQQVHETKYPLELESNMIHNPEDAILIKIPCKKPEWMWDE